MSDQFVAEIRMFPFNFPPTGWAFCDGQLMPISQNTALFALLGTVYGGDGKSTFALPNLQGSAAIQPGVGLGLSQRFLGEVAGSETITLLTSEIPVHAHAVMADNLDPADLNIPTAQRVLAQSTGVFGYQPSNANLTNMAPQAIGVVGGDLPHTNMMPSLVLNFCIALQGIFPQRP